MSFHKSFAFDDPMNINHARTIRNTPMDEYNCAGYALGTFSWYQIDNPWDFDTDEAQLEHAVAQLLEDFPTLRRVHSLEEVSKREEVIAFRFGDIDYHFVVRKLNGIWYHKRGAVEQIEKMTQKQVFSAVWNTSWVCYNGPIALFAHTI